MNILRRRAMMQSRAGISPVLPAEYQQVEWIGSSGTQYINTRYTLYEKGIYCNFMLDSINSSNEICVFGKLEPGYTGYYWLYKPTDSQMWGVTRGRKSFPVGEITTNQWHTLSIQGDYNNPTVEFDGVPKPQSSESAGNATTYRPIYLFGNNFNESFRYGATCKIKRFTIDNFADFIPAYRKSDGVIGMYDIIRNAFYTNSGTGTFTKGADVN